MEAEPKSVLFSFFFLISLCAGLRYQTLSPGTLPIPSKLNPDVSWTESETVTLPDSAQAETQTQSTLALSLRLEHIDALASDLTAESLFKLRLDRDAIRVGSLLAKAAGVPFKQTPGEHFSSSIISGLAQGSGEYFTRLGIGTPPTFEYLVLDTGSDINWIQCKPCARCYNQTDRLFDPAKSHTYAAVPCRSAQCQKLDSSGCDRQKQRCLYQVSYGDGSFTVGVLSTETLTFRRTKIANVMIGCGHDNEGLFVGAAGLLGLGQGKLSFPAQAGAQFKQKFSYCLVDRSASSKPSSLLFGESAVSHRARYTPLAPNKKLDTFYYVNLLGISVGGSPVRAITPSLFKLDQIGNGGVIIDSGTSVTRLTMPAYTALRDEFKKKTKNLKLTDGFSLFDTCYDLRGKAEVKVPTVVLHFENKVDMSLPATNYLIPVDNEGTFCFAFAGTASGLSIIGNIQQQGFRVMFDLAKSMVGFYSGGCT
ncbi:aspartyl protease family protein 2 [Malania oleifera]|uniref:aspartyl protease family protein 2 n=1 Tax=Malania oleifera TaxID=397392 RepID=UPI0025ADE8E2|nr:aspartyl protease family protein 2 [Malania oleifera]